jgi:hypothetical protein
VFGDFVCCELPCGYDDGSKNEKMDELGGGKCMQQCSTNFPKRVILKF